MPQIEFGSEQANKVRKADREAEKNEKALGPLHDQISATEQEIEELSDELDHVEAQLYVQQKILHKQQREIRKLLEGK